MPVSAVIKDGQIVETASQTSVSNASNTSSTPKGYDKDSFLQLLVAQMKYQDPLEPTSNTEYISQYATFSQVEQLQNMASTMELSRASSYVGKVVQISSTDSKGETTTVEGVVDFIKYESGKAYVSIEGNLYSADDITAVIDTDYNNASKMAEAFAEGVNNLPKLENLTLADAPKVQELVEVYGAIGSLAQSLIDDSYQDVLKAYVAKIKELQAAQATANNENTSTGDASTEDTTSDTTEEA